MNELIKWFLRPPTDGPASVVLLRLMAGGVFFSEGILKFVYANQGVGRFTKLGIPFPELTANCIGVLEIVGGLALVFGLATRVFSLLFIGEMIVGSISSETRICRPGMRSRNR